MTKRLSAMQENLCYLTTSKPGLFAVTMGTYDRVEVCELVGSFLRYASSLKYDKTNRGLYSDDGLAVFRSVSGTHCEKTKKKFRKLFR